MNKLLVFAVLMLCQLICCLALSIIAPFFPPYAKDKGISLDVIGIIFAANPLGAIVASLILGKIMTEKNRFQFMVTALMMQSLGLFIFALTNYQDDPAKIIATAVASRLINGFATSFFLTPLYAYIPVLFPESIEQKISIAEVFASLGFLIGPVFGSILYSFGGYLTPFVSFGALSFVLSPIIGLFFSRLDQEKNLVVVQPLEGQSSLLIGSNSDEQTNIKQLLSQASTPIEKNNTVLELDTIPLDYSQVLSNFPILMTSVTCFSATFMFNFLSPLYADFFENYHGAEPSTVGYYLCVLPAAYSFTSLMIGYIQTQKTKSILIGTFVMGIAAYFAGPDKDITQLDHNIYITLASLGIMGVSAAPIIIYNIPVLNDYLSSNFPNQPTQCANMASALFNTACFAGELIGPILAGLLADRYSFDFACSAMGSLVLLSAFLFIPVLWYKHKEHKLHRSTMGIKNISMII